MGDERIAGDGEIGCKANALLLAVIDRRDLVEHGMAQNGVRGARGERRAAVRLSNATAERVRLVGKDDDQATQWWHMWATTRCRPGAAIAA